MTGWQRLVWQTVAYRFMPRWLRYWVVIDVHAQAMAGLDRDAAAALTAGDLATVAMKGKRRWSDPGKTGRAA
jgi:hypothetical protein